MTVTIRHKRSAVAGKIPAAANLAAGELAMNTVDGKLFIKRDDGAIITFSMKPDNAGAADKLSTVRTISLTGDVTGSASFDGSGNVSITAAVADDSHNHIIANVDGLQAALDGKEPTIAVGTTAQYRRGDKTWRDFATDVRAAVLTGLSTATSAVVAATDSVVVAIGKLQAQINALGTGKLNVGANAVSATKLATSRNINGVPFDGTADITVPFSPIAVPAYLATGALLKLPLATDNTLTVGTAGGGSLNVMVIVNG